MAQTSESPLSVNDANRIAVTKIQKIIASRMLASKQNIPCFYLKESADVTDLAGFRRQFGRQHKAKISTNDCIIFAMAQAAAKYPLMVGQLVDDYVQIAPTVNIGLAVATPQGLVVPVVKDAHKKTLLQIAADTQLLSDKARSNALALTDLEGACITLTNLGVYEIESFYAVSPPGQCSIAAIGKTIETCIPKDGGFVNHKMMAITVSADYRIVTATYAAAFLNCVIDQLQDPQSLAIE